MSSENRGGWKLLFFRQTAADVQQRRLWMLKSSILLLIFGNSSKMDVFSSKKTKIFRQEEDFATIFRQPKIKGEEGNWPSTLLHPPLTATSLGKERAACVVLRNLNFSTLLAYSFAEQKICVLGHAHFYRRTRPSNRVEIRPVRVVRLSASRHVTVRACAVVRSALGGGQLVTDALNARRLLTSTSQQCCS